MSVAFKRQEAFLRGQEGGRKPFGQLDLSDEGFYRKNNVIPGLISSDNVHLLSEDDMDDDPLDFESRYQQFPDIYEGSEDDFDVNSKMVQALRSEEHHRDSFDDKSEQIQTCEASESDTKCTQKEVIS